MKQSKEEISCLFFLILMFSVAHTITLKGARMYLAGISQSLCVHNQHNERLFENQLLVSDSIATSRVNIPVGGRGKSDI